MKVQFEDSTQTDDTTLSDSRYIRFIPLGGGNEASAASYLFSFDDIHLLIDCGVRYYSKYRYPDYNFLRRLLGSWKSVDAVFVSHFHMDHCGAILPVFENLDAKDVYASKVTKDMIKSFLLHQLEFESASIDDEQLKNELSEYRSKVFNKSIEKISTFEYNEPIIIKSKHSENKVTIVPVPSGHLLGAAAFIIEYKGKKIFFSSDYQPEQLYSVGTYPYIPDDTGFDIMFLDGTNFYSQEIKLPITKKEQEEQIVEAVNHSILKREKVIFPVPSIGHAQEIVKLLENAILKGLLHDVTVAVDGFVNVIIKYFEEWFRRKRIQFLSSTISRLARKHSPDELIDKYDVIVTSPKNFLNPNTRAYQIIHRIKERNISHLIMSLFDPSNPSYFTEQNVAMLDNLNIKYYRLDTHILPSMVFKLIAQVKAKTVILIHSNIKSQVTEELIRWIHPLRYPRGVSIIQSINNMPIYL